jgi:hypothetical protein
MGLQYFWPNFLYGNTSMDEIAYGYCHCGCGLKTTFATRSKPKEGITLGQPNKFLPHHHRRMYCGPKNKSWKGGLYKDKKGYMRVMKKDHPRADDHGYVLEHILIVEVVMGKALPVKAEIHHIDGIGSRNEHSNLVACQSHGYHMLLHRIQKALRACGNPSWRECRFCHEYDDPKKLTIYGRRAQHQDCASEYKRNLQRSKNAAV